jgi:hypothetical protein
MVSLKEIRPSSAAFTAVGFASVTFTTFGAGFFAAFDTDAPSAALQSRRIVSAHAVARRSRARVCDRLSFAGGAHEELKHMGVFIVLS